MVNINVDTVRLRECGKDIMSLTSELNELFILMYNEIDKVQWSGIAANEFKRKLGVEKVYNIALKDNLYKYGKLLYDAADQFEVCINKIKIQ